MSKPDYKSPSFRGALMTNTFALHDEREHSMIQSKCIAEVHRASQAITVISRLVHNSLSEPDMSGAEPLGAPAHAGLLSALEIVGIHLEEVVDAMRETAVNFAKFEEAPETNHG